MKKLDVELYEVAMKDGPNIFVAAAGHFLVRCTGPTKELAIQKVVDEVVTLQKATNIVSKEQLYIDVPETP